MRLVPDKPRNAWRAKSDEMLYIISLRTMAHNCGRWHSSRLHRHPVMAGAAKGSGPTPHRRAPTHEEIARLAYHYWEAGGRRQGSAWEDWLRAERELRGE
jgi:hypothetical protein